MKDLIAKSYGQATADGERARRMDLAARRPAVGQRGTTVFVLDEGPDHPIFTGDSEIEARAFVTQWQRGRVNR